jgi:hypothetical protein
MGFTPGSLSKVPAGIEICDSLTIGILEPHELQKTRLMPGLDSKDFNNSSPATHWKLFISVTCSDEENDPVAFWQLLQ